MTMRNGTGITQAGLESILFQIQHNIVGTNEKKKCEVFMALQKLGLDPHDLVQIVKAAIEQIGDICLRYAAPLLKRTGLDRRYIFDELLEVRISPDELSRELSLAF